MKMDATNKNLLPGCNKETPYKCHNLFVFLCISISLVFISSCKDKNRVHPDPVEWNWNFSSGNEGWTGDFSGYPEEDELLYELIFEHDTLPSDQTQRALKLSGNNINSNLFMFAKKRIAGLDPLTVYYITFSVEFASNLTDINNSQLVYLAAGATPFEPLKVKDEDNVFGMNIDKCNQGQNGEDMIVLDNLTNDSNQQVFTLKTLENELPFHCTTNERGEVWIIIGIDSGYASTITVYLNSVNVELF